MNLLPIIITIIGSIFSLIVAVVACTWVIGNRFAKVEAELAGQLSAFREVMLAMNRRIERLESKIP